MVMADTDISMGIGMIGAGSADISDVDGLPEVTSEAISAEAISAGMAEDTEVRSLTRLYIPGVFRGV